MKGYYKIVAMICLLGMLFSGCGTVGQVKQKEKKRKDSIEIGFLFDTFSLERWQRDRDIFVSAATDLGAEVNVQCANGDIKKQREQLLYMIEKRVDAIVMVQVSDEEEDLHEEVNMAKDEGIPVIAYDRLVENADIDLYISFDNEQVGRMMAAHMLAHIREGKILMINGPLSDHNCVEIEKGFVDAFEKNHNKQQELVGIEHAEGWLAEYGSEYTENYLKAYGSLKGVMGGNDGIAGEALTVLAEKRLAGNVCVVGQDADLAACQKIVEGTQCMTVYKPIDKLAKMAAELSVSIAKGQGVPEDLQMINNGMKKVPYCRLQPIAVTQGNMDEYITGQYHSQEDIYLNVNREKREATEEETEQTDQNEAAEEIPAEKTE